MLQMVQLQDGCYRVTVDYEGQDFSLHKEWIFAVTESDADPMENGERITLEFK